MSSMQPSEIQDELRDQAAAWVVRMHAEPSVVDLERFAQWRAQSPLHERAFNEVAASWMAVGEHATAPKLLAMRRDALERARQSGRHQSRRQWSRRTLAAAIAVMILAPLLGLAWYQLRPPAAQQFQTAHGEQRVIVLTDGSRMSLDAVTQVAVRYTSDVRSVELLAGRASFEVAKDLTRPLKVKAGPRTVTAIGTVFTVERAPRNVVVTLMEGLVAVTSGDANAAHLELRPRQELRMDDSGAVELREDIDPDQALAWREGKLIFDDESLATVVARMNNYVTTPIVVAGRTAELRVSGVFKAGDTSAFVDAMKSYFPVTAARQPNAVTLRLSETPAEVN
jgi:transmembrane sensor